MKESWQNLFDLIVNPSATFTRLKSKPRWVVASFVFCSLSLLLSWTTAPFIEQLLSVLKSDVATTTSFASYLTQGIITAILWCVVLSTILTLVARVFKINKALKFRHIYAGVVHTALVSTMVYLVNIGLLPVFRRVEYIEQPIEMRVVPGLHMLAGSIENVSILSFLSHINPLSAWYVFVLTIAVVVLAEVSITKACFTALIIFLLRIGTEILFLNMVFY